jgi:pantetheine-phosphate adenylyltransferase
MKKIAFSGTLDPITNGHMWVIGEARTMAEEVTVFLSENPFKKPQFGADQRKRVIEESVAQRGWSNVRVLIVKGDYTARAAKQHGIDYLIRGIRSTADFDYENLIQQTNVDVLQGAKTIFVMPPRDLGSVSSSFVKALQGPVGWHWIMKQFVPPPAYQAWIVDWLRKEWEALWPCYAQAAAQAQPEQVSEHVAHQVANANKWFEHLTGPLSHGAPQRHYHNLDHLVHGLTEIRVWARNTNPSAVDVDTVRKAFWFHDAVYTLGHKPSPDPQSQALTNEEASARLWLGSGLHSDLDSAPAESGAPADMAQSVASLIRATDHFQASSITHPLKAVMLGADLAILGQSEAVYAQYSAAIRDEYAHVPLALYQSNRREALQHLHAKAQANALYLDAYFAQLYNQQAMANMAREIAL